MEVFNRGDVVAREITPGQVEFIHVEQIGADGKMSGIADATGKPVGLDTRRDVLRVASMAEALEARQRAAGRAGGGA